MTRDEPANAPAARRRLALDGHSAHRWLRAQGWCTPEKRLSLYADEVSHAGVHIARWAMSTGCMKSSLICDDSTRVFLCSLNGPLVCTQRERRTPVPGGAMASFRGGPPVTAETRNTRSMVVVSFRLDRSLTGDDDEAPSSLHHPARLLRYSRSQTLLATATAAAILSSELNPAHAGFGGMLASIESILESLLRTAEQTDRERADPRQLTVARARGRIIARANDPSFSIMRLADDLGVSVSYLHRCFRTAGSTPMRELRRHRLSLAHDLGIDEAGTTAEREHIARAAGFISLRRLELAVEQHAEAID